MSYSILNCKTHYSLLRSIIQPSQLPLVLKTLGISTCAITDYATISGCVNFHTQLKEGGIKPILGVELNICPTMIVKEGETYSLTLLAKNREGWNDIVKIVSLSNSPEYWSGKPRIDLETLIQNINPANIIAYSGGKDSIIDNIITKYGKEKGLIWAKKLAEMFVGGFYLYIDIFSSNHEIIREISRESGIISFGNPNPHYCRIDDVILQRIVLCSEYKTTLQKGHPSHFFSDNRYYVWSLDEMKVDYTEDEINNSNLIANQIEEFDVGNPPIFPRFDCPNGLSEDEYLRELCREGWLKKIKGKIPVDKEEEYVGRIKYELEVLQGAGLSSYFLVLADVLNFVRDGECLVLADRGSAAGCLAAYLVNIISTNPIPYNLQFERFYNAGRNTPGKVTLPDIDLDIPIQKRDATIEYIRDKYGIDKVAQILTYQTIKGKGALKMVFRAYDDISFEEQNKITEIFPEDSKIADELQEMKEAGEEPSIIMWALENRADKLAEWVKLNDDGKLEGRLALYFEQGIKLEKTKSAQSRHASGVVVSSEQIGNYAPMMYDNNSRVVGYEMNECEQVGLVKLDILGLSTLDRLMTIRDILRNGEITV